MPKPELKGIDCDYDLQLDLPSLFKVTLHIGPIEDEAADNFHMFIRLDGAKDGDAFAECRAAGIDMDKIFVLQNNGINCTQQIQKHVERTCERCEGTDWEGVDAPYIASELHALWEFSS